MKFMHCGSCSGICQVNATGICLSCQRGFINLPQEDSWFHSEDREKAKLQDRKEELEIAIQKSSTTESAIRSTSGDSKRVRTPHAQRKKASQES